MPDTLQVLTTYILRIRFSIIFFFQFWSIINFPVQLVQHWIVQLQKKTPSRKATSWEADDLSMTATIFFCFCFVMKLFLVSYARRELLVMLQLKLYSVTVVIH